jgi:hypothetical protein
MLTNEEIRKHIDTTKNDPIFKELYPRAVLVEIYQSFPRELQRELSWERLTDSLALAYFSLKNHTAASSWSDMVWFQVWESSTNFIKLVSNRLAGYKRKLAGICEVFWKGDQIRRNHLYKRGRQPEQLFDLSNFFETEDSERLASKIGNPLYFKALDAVFDNGFKINHYNWQTEEDPEDKIKARNEAKDEIAYLVASSYLANTGELTDGLLEVALNNLKKWGTKRESVKGAFEWMVANLSKVHQELPGWSLPECFAEILETFKLTPLAP